MPMKITDVGACRSCAAVHDLRKPCCKACEHAAVLTFARVVTR